MQEFQVHEYVITSDILGSGGHGDVFIGKNLDSNQNVAIKCFMLDSERNKMAYDNEKKALEFMSSNSGIIDLVDCFEHNGIGLIVMELAEYDLLDYYIEKNPSESDLKKLLLSLAHSIKVLHMNGIAHLDLKPENCLVFGNENIKLCDFGNALFFRENIRYYGRRGSPGYVAPEMEEGIPFNPKAADIWGLGILFHVLITGCFPYRNVDNAEQQEYSREHFNLRCTDGLLLDLLRKMLKFDQKNRITIDEVIKHPYFTSEVRDIKPSITTLRRIKKQARRLLQSA